VYLRNRDDYHTVIISSTVMPGDCDGPVREALEKASGKKVGKSLGLCCCPEFVALGNILHGFLEPDFVVIGASDIKADFQAQNLYRRLCLNDPPVHHMSLTSAEIAKIGLNVAVVTKMAMAAQITWICQRYPGANADAVLAAIGDDSRIGRSFFARTLWPGGPCFPRDSASFIAAARRVDQPVPVAEGTHTYLQVQIAEMASWLEALADGGRMRIGVLGLTYKAGVSVTDDSYGLALADLLRQRGQKVKVCDPHVPKTMSLKDTVTTSDVLVVTVDHAEFRALEEMDLQGKVVVDCRGFLNEDRISGRYVHQGRGT
jgi:UDPglucose 6-dehydrogenase